jgi:tRNA G18 (ribose-2'-O)-methylase SpoU
VRITTRNARFQQWQALSTNRSKRQRAGEFLVQGVRPITLAVAHGWPLRAVLHRDRAALSDWARELLDTVDAPRYAVAGDLLDELGDRADPGTEMIVVAGMPADDLARIPVGDGFLGVVFDRPGSPGNIGTIVRSADAFGAHGVVVTGHAADPYDPKAVRASTGSLFAVPVVRVASHRGRLRPAGAHPHRRRRQFAQRRDRGRHPPVRGRPPAKRFSAILTGFGSQGDRK